MSVADCIFCKIINKEIPCLPVLETEDIIVIKDISPKAPIHYLILPKKHVNDIRALEECDVVLAGKLLMTAKQVSASHDNIPFKLLVNNGHEAGQRVYHMHIHFLAGGSLPEWL